VQDAIRDYIDRLQQGLRAIDPTEIERVIRALAQARREERQVFLIGNGGSAATASHMANDLQKFASHGKGVPFRAIALTDNVPLLTAWANDDCYDCVFSRQLAALSRPGDLLIAITGSGNSPNILAAMRWAAEHELTTVAFLGFDGGAAKGLADHVLLFPEEHYGRVEDAHMVLDHLVVNLLRDLPDPDA